MKASDAPIVPSELPHVPLRATAELYDIATVTGPSLTTVRKDGASTPGVNMDEIWKKRGGKPNHRPIKTGGNAFKTTANEIASERKRRKDS
jgi:hypothetical protein